MRKRDELTEGYLAHYGLEENLSERHVDQAVLLISALRELRRMRFPGRREALMARQKLWARINHTKLFYSCDHKGFNEFLTMMTASLEALDRQIAERFN